MAKGDFLVFDEVKKTMADTGHNLTADSFSVMLITTLPGVADATPDSTDYIEVTAGGGYAAGGVAITTTWLEANGTATMASSTSPAWSAAAGSPTNIVAALVYNTTHAGTADAIGFIDMTVDAGTTPISLVAGDISIAWDAGTDLFDLV